MTNEEHSPIVEDGHPALEMIAAEVPHGADVTDIIRTMRYAQSSHPRSCVGLAANQIGETVRIILIVTDTFDGAIINPVYVRHGKTLKHSREGCISFPGFDQKMIRHEIVEIQGYNEDWQPVRYKLKRFLAFVAQHEMDHLDGFTLKNPRPGTFVSETRAA